MDLDLKKLQEIDPLKPQPTVDLKQNEGLSPMDPPEAYAANLPEGTPVEEMHPLLQELISEHISFKQHIQLFDEALSELQKTKNLTPSDEAKIQNFFKYFDEEFIPHNRKEERHLFPLLSKRLLESGEHSKGRDPITAVDVLESEHVQAMQLGAVIQNLMTLLPQVEDPKSKNTLRNSLIDNGKVLIEMLGLHIFREDSIAFALAQKLMSAEDFTSMA